MQIPLSITVASRQDQHEAMASVFCPWQHSVRTGRHTNMGWKTHAAASVNAPNSQGVYKATSGAVHSSSPTILELKPKNAVQDRPAHAPGNQPTWTPNTRTCLPVCRCCDAAQQTRHQRQSAKGFQPHSQAKYCFDMLLQLYANPVRYHRSTSRQGRSAPVVLGIGAEVQRHHATRH